MTWKRKIMGFFVLISLVLCMVVPIETRAAVMRSGKWVTRVGEVFSLLDRNYSGATKLTKRWWISDGNACVSIDGNGYTCTVTALSEGRATICCQTNATMITTVYNPITNKYDSYSSSATRTVNYHIIVEGERTLTFDANGGKASISQMKVYTQTEVGTLPTAERAGYEFTGWYSEKEGGNQITSTAIYMADRTVYAHWKKNQYDITFDANGGINSTAKIVIKNGHKLGGLPTVKRSGYQFTGWYTSKSGGSQVTSDTIPTDDVRYYAHWKKVSVGKSSLSNVEVGYGQLNVSFDKVKGASGYQIWYSQNAKFKKAAKKNLTKTSISLKNLKKGKTYYIRVRAYKKDSANSKIYGAFSKVQKVKLPAVLMAQKEKTLLTGQKETCKLLGAKGKITWSTSNKSVVAVSKKGIVTAKKKGNAVITAMYKGKQYKCRIRVEVPAFQISSAVIIRGERKKIDFSGTSLDVTYRSDDPGIAAVDANGNVLAVSEGTTKIRAIVNKKTYTCVVTVEAPYLNETSLTLDEGEGVKLTLNGTAYPVTWKSMDDSVAFVSSKGTVSALAPGSTYVVATVYGKSFYCLVNVQQGSN